ncbi:MAG: hypothetical protein HKN23_14435 [Verrucomicrobiales bacterium]|nr:hypothetical protein [Verrucomicrobiales bacterium]
MKKLVTTIALSVAVFATTTTGLHAQSDQDIGTLLPEETSVLFLVRSLPVIYELDESHPLKKLGNHPAVRHVFGEATSSAEEMLSEDTLKDLGLSEDDLARLFPGRMVMAGNLDLKALMDASAQQAAEGAGGGQANMNLSFNGGFSFLVAADTTMTEQELTELVEAFGNRLVETEETVKESRSFKEEFQGYPLIKLETKVVSDTEEGWTAYSFILTDSILVMTMLPEEGNLDNHIASDMCRRIRSQGTEPNSLAGTRSYIDARDQLAEADLFAFAPLSEMAKTFEQAIGDMYDTAAQQAQDGNAQAQGMNLSAFVQKEALLDFLGLTNFKRFTMAAKIQPDGLEMVQELATNERTGMIAKMMNYEQGIQLPEMDPTGLKGIQISGFKMAETMENLMTEIPNLSPMLGGLLQMQIAQMEAQGLKIRNGLMPAMGPGMVHVYGYSSATPADDQVPSHAFIFNAKDPIGLSQSMNEVSGFMQQAMGGGGELDEAREFMGENVQRLDALADILGGMVNAPEGSSGAWAVVGDKFVITVGEEKMIDHIIASMKKGGANLEDLDTLGDEWRRWDNENLVEFAYEDFATILKMAAYGGQGAIQVRAQANPGDVTDAERAAEQAIEDMPPVDDLNYSITTKTYDTPDAWISRIYVAEKP